jgi:protein phosphatase
MNVSEKTSEKSCTTPVIPLLRPPPVVWSYGLTDPGRVRASNEDHFAVLELTRALTVHQTSFLQPAARYSSHRAHAFLVADGMGGHQAGEVASCLSVEAVEAFLLDTLKRFSNLQACEEPNALQELQTALRYADAQIFEEASRHPEWQGVGTTLTLAFLVNWRLFLAHAGDSRCYLFSEGVLRQLTRDHSFVAELVRRGVVPPGKGPRHPYRHLVTNVLGGPKPGVGVELHRLDLHPEDRILLCSDGLTDMVPDEGIAAVLGAEPEPQRACEQLVALANERDGEDNITVIVARMMSAEGAQAGG